MRNRKVHIVPFMSRDDKKLFDLVEDYKQNGGTFGEEAQAAFRSVLAEKLRNPPKADPAETAEAYRTFLLRLLEFATAPGPRLKKPYRPVSPRTGVKIHLPKNGRKGNKA